MSDFITTLLCIVLLLAVVYAFYTLTLDFYRRLRLRKISKEIDVRSIVYSLTKTDNNNNKYNKQKGVFTIQVLADTTTPTVDVVTQFLQIIVNSLSTLVSAFGQAISTGIGSIFKGSSGALSDGGIILAMGVGIGMAIGLVRIAWNFFANIGHRQR